MTINALWVEEESSSLRYERGRAKELGWEITLCETVIQASELIRSNTFDLLILDLILPMDQSTLHKGMVETEAGITLLKDIRDPSRLGQTSSDVPILIISAVGSMEQRLKVIKMLPDERFFLPKPVDEKAYMKILHELDQQLARLPDSPI